MRWLDARIPFDVPYCAATACTGERPGGRPHDNVEKVLHAIPYTSPPPPTSGATRQGAFAAALHACHFNVMRSPSLARSGGRAVLYI